MIHEVSMPMIGEDIREARVTRILVRAGNRILMKQPILELSTDKVDLDFVSPLSGTIVEILVRENQMVAVGGGLARIETHDDEDVANRKIKMADLFQALEYLAGRDIHYLCSRQELGDLTFDEFRDFVEDTGDTAKRFAGLRFENLDEKLEDKLRTALFFVTDLIKSLQGFKPKDLGHAKTREYKRIHDLLTRDSEYALQRFRDVLIDAGLEMDVAEYDPSKAYVFISYAHADAPSANRLARSLGKARIAYFLDKHVSFGEELPQRIQNEVARASHMIVLISSGSAKSAWVPFEMGIAKANGIQIIPYVLHSEMHVPSFISNNKRLTEAGEEARLIKDLSRFSRKAKLAGDEPRLEGWRNALAKERLLTAQEVWHQSVASYPSILDSAEELEHLVGHGGQLRCILTDPWGKAIEQGIIRNMGASARQTYLASQFNATKEALKGIARSASHGGGVTLKMIDFLPDPILTVIDPSQEEGVIFVTLNGFGQNPASRPSFLLRKQRDTAWFGFYRESFHQLWEHPLAKEIDLL